MSNSYTSSNLKGSVSWQDAPRTLTSCDDDDDNNNREPTTSVDPYDITVSTSREPSPVSERVVLEDMFVQLPTGIVSPHNGDPQVSSPQAGVKPFRLLTPSTTGSTMVNEEDQALTTAMENNSAFDSFPAKMDTSRSRGSVASSFSSMKQSFMDSLSIPLFVSSSSANTTDAAAETIPSNATDMSLASSSFLSLSPSSLEILQVLLPPGTTLSTFHSFSISSMDLSSMSGKSKAQSREIIVTDLKLLDVPEGQAIDQGEYEHGVKAAVEILAATGMYEDAACESNEWFRQGFLKVLPHVLCKQGYAWVTPKLAAIMDEWNIEARKLVRGEPSALSLSHLLALSMAYFPFDIVSVVNRGEIFKYSSPLKTSGSNRNVVEPNRLEMMVADFILHRAGIKQLTDKNATMIGYFRYILAFRMRNGHFSIPKKVHYVQGHCVGKHVENLRNQGHADAEYKAALDMIGFNWTVRASTWLSNFEELKQYAMNHAGSCAVPRREGYLGKWVSRQRTMKKKLEESVARGEEVKDREPKEEKIRLLSSIGFIWNAKSS